MVNLKELVKEIDDKLAAFEKELEEMQDVGEIATNTYRTCNSHLYVLWELWRKLKPSLVRSKPRGGTRRRP